MGAAFHNIPADAAAFSQAIQAAPDGIVWIVGRREDRGQTKGGKQRKGEWHLQGVAFDKKTAVSMCRDETYFCGPLPINVLLPHKTIPWIGLFWPKKKGPKPTDLNL